MLVSMHTDLRGLSLRQMWACMVPQVLRFYCIWDDRQRLFGDRQPFRLHYFLEDDTVEILEEPANNSGRDPFPIFLRRTPLPKVCLALQCRYSWTGSLML